MFQLLFLSILFGLSKQQGCVKVPFVSKSRDLYPKPGVFCTDSEIESRWRGELDHKQLEDSSGIKLNWKYLVQRPDCDSVELKFYDEYRKTVYPKCLEANVTIKMTKATIKNENEEEVEHSTKKETTADNLFKSTTESSNMTVCR